MNESIPALLSVDGNARLSSTTNSVQNPSQSPQTTEMSPFMAFLASYFQSTPEQGNAVLLTQLPTTLPGESLPTEEAALGNDLPPGTESELWGLFFLANPQLQPDLNNATATGTEPAVQLLAAKRTPAQPLDSGVLLMNSTVAAGDDSQDINQTFINALSRHYSLPQDKDALANATRLETGFNNLLLDNNSNSPLLSQPVHGVSSATPGLNTVTVATQALHSAPALNPSQPSWDEAIASRLQFMLGQNVQKAEIRLDPPDLGLIEVQVQVNRDQAHVHFTSPHAQVRDAIEAAVPRLREMFAESGLSLADVNVQQENLAQRQNQSGSDESGSASRTRSAAEESEAVGSVTASRTISRGLLDAYA